MNARIVVTASLIPLAAVAAFLAPALVPATPVPAAPSTPPPPVEVVAAVPVTAPVAVGDGGVHLSVTADRDVLYADGDRTMRVRVDWWADADEQGERATLPTDLIVVLDRSGSMQGEKILDAKAAAAELVSLLGPEDRFSLVTFASDVRVDVPLAVTDRAAWNRAIDGIYASGGTDLRSGLSVGLRQVVPVSGRSRRVVLVSDGRPDNATGLEQLARDSARAETPLTAIGIGVDYDEALLQSLADAGSGNFYWTRRGPELQTVLAAELSTARETVASGVRLALGDGATIVDAGGLQVYSGAVDLGTLHAGQRRSLWVTVRVPPTADATTFDLGSFDLSFTTPAGQAGLLVADAPSVALVHDPKVAFGALGDSWADSVVTDDYNRLKTEVSASVQAGDQGAALAAIAAYRADNALMNAYAQNPVVDGNLAEVDQLQEQVAAQFVGADQQARQNTWAKGSRVEAYSKRRVGSVMPSPAPR